MLLFVFMTVIRRHHVCNAIWTPYTGELLLVRKEPANTRNGRAVAIVTTERTVVGHVPQEIPESCGIFWVMVGTLRVRSQATGDTLMV